MASGPCASDLERAQLVEFSEASAYESLACGVHADGAELAARKIGSGVAIISASIRTTLNLNRVIGLGIGSPSNAAEVDQIAAMYGARGLSFGVEVSPLAQPDNLVHWLKARGMRRGLATAMHYRRTSRVSAPAGDVHVRLAAESETGLVAAILSEVFRLPSAAHRVFANARSSAHWRFWLAEIGGATAGAALSFVGERTAWLGWDATLPVYRSRGVQVALIACRLNDAAESGCEFATSETGVGTADRPDPSFRNYQKAGFAKAYCRFTYISINRNAPTET